MNTIRLSAAELANLSDLELARREEQLNQWDLLTRDELRDKIEVVEEKIRLAETEESKAYSRSRLKHSWPSAETHEPDWNKRELVHFFEDLDFEGAEEGIFKGLDYSPAYTSFKNLPPSKTTICGTTFEHRTWNAKLLCDKNEEVTKVKLFWSTETEYVPTKVFGSWAENKELIRITKLNDHFKSGNWSFPLLLGSQHNNRFKRDTKIYVLSGEHKGKYGTVVGHGTNFDLNRWGTELGIDPHHFTDNRAPLLKVLLICPLGVLKIHDIRQDIVKLIDLHRKLKFALPALRPADFVDEPDLFGVKRRKVH